MNDNIKKLQEQIAQEQRKIDSCSHQFSFPEKEYYSEMEPYGFKTVAQGSDVWTEAEGYREVQKERWVRKCRMCGFCQYTTKTEPIITGYQPKF